MENEKGRRQKQLAGQVDKDGEKKRKKRDIRAGKRIRRRRKTNEVELEIETETLRSTEAEIEIFGKETRSPQ